jgi:hypothetical protein
MTEKPGDKHMPSLYARTWVLVFIWGGALLVPIGASLLFSFVPEVDWRVCATLCVILLLTLVILLVIALASRPSTSWSHAAPRGQSEGTSAWPMGADGKCVTGKQLGNVILMTEGHVTLIVAYLAGAVLIGLILNALFGLWWADLLASLVIVYYGMREGMHAWRGEEEQHA